MAEPLDVDLLEDVLSGALPPAKAPRSIASLATLASTLSSEIRPLDAPEDVRYRLRDQLIESMDARPGRLQRLRDRGERLTAGWRHSVRVATASAVASTLIGTTGVAAAAQAALPGDLLYGVKQLTEDARLAFAAGDVDEGRLHLAFARERLEEVEDGARRLPAETLAATLAEMDEQAVAGANQLLAAHAGGAGETVLAELTAFTDDQRARLFALRDDLPLVALAAAETSAEVLRRIDAQVDGLLQPGCRVCGEPARVPLAPPATGPIAPRVVLPADGPAVAPGCNCVGEGPVDPTVPREDPTDTSPPATDQDPPPTNPSEEDPGPDTDDGPTEDDGGLSDDVTDLLDPLPGAGDLVDDLLEDTDLDDPVDDVGDVVDDVVDDLSEPVPHDGESSLLEDLLGG